MANLYLSLSILLPLQYVCGLNVVVTNFTQCGEPMTSVKFTFGIPNKGHQLLSFDYNSPVENGDNFRLEFVVKLLRGKNWHKLLGLKEENLCKALFTYLPSIMNKAVDLAGEPRKCPLRKGTIRARNMPLDFSKFQLIPIPKGKVSLLGKSYEKSTGKLGICVYFEGDSI